MNAGLEEIANRAVDRLAELAAGYIGEGRNCTDCGEWKVWGEFHNSKKGKNGKRSICKNCHNKFENQRKQGLKRPAWEKPETIICRGKCKRELPFDKTNFSKRNATSRFGLSLVCKPCDHRNRNVRRTLNKKHAKEEANGRCYACNKETDKLVLDHDHETDEFRGWACHSCNRKLALPYSAIKA